MDAACIPRNGNDHHVPQDYCLSARSWCSVLLLKQRSEWKLHRSAPHGTFPFFLFLIQVCRLSVYTLKYKTCKKNHNATLRTLGVLYSLLVVEGQGAHPGAKEGDPHHSTMRVWAQMRFGQTPALPSPCAQLCHTPPFSPRGFSRGSALGCLCCMVTSTILPVVLPSFATLLWLACDCMHGPLSLSLQ